MSLKNNPEKEEKKELFKIENKIHDMLNKVMEEKDSLICINDTINEKSIKINKISISDKTLDLSIQNNYNQNLTEVSNNNERSKSFASEFSKDSPMKAKEFLYFQNNLNNNIFLHNIFQNSLQKKNITNKILNNNKNNSNSSFPSILTYNNKFNDNKNINRNIFQNTTPYSNNDIYNRKINYIKKLIFYFILTIL